VRHDCVYTEDEYHFVSDKPKDKLISAAYSATLSPEKYDDFMNTLDDLMFEGPSQNANGQSGEHIIDTDLDNHFQRAHDIQIKLGRDKAVKPTAVNIVEKAPGPAISFSASEHIIAMNKLAIDTGHGSFETLADYCTNPDLLTRIRAFIANTDASNILVESGNLSEAADTNTCIIVRKINLNEDNTERPAAEAQYFLTSSDLGFDPSKSLLFQKTYKLTDAETDIAVKLADGLAPVEIADARQANLATIRTQIKSIKKKTKSRDLSGIVRLIYGISASLFVSSQVSDVASINVKTLSPYKRQGMITLNDGRKMVYYEQGDAKGIPVILFHNIIYGAGVLESTSKAASRMGLRILAPLRPGFGSSDFIHDAYGDNLLTAAAADLCEFMDRLSIPKAIIVGQTTATPYALRFARLYPHRTADLLGISHAPIWRDEWMNALPKRQKLMARITKYAPKLLPLVTRAGIAMFDKGHADKFLNAAHGDIPADAKALKHPETYAHILNGLEETVAQSAEAFRRDSPFTTLDFTEEARRLKHPFHIIHGDSNHIFPMSNIEAFLEEVPGTTLEVVKGAGGFLIYSHWEVVLRTLKKKARNLK
jgi:pimeloyl-ACP methyl ester carboxylesterase/DNA-binding CsgD family transcriptional regulator